MAPKKEVPKKAAPDTAPKITNWKLDAPACIEIVLETPFEQHRAPDIQELYETVLEYIPDSSGHHAKVRYVTATPLPRHCHATATPPLRHLMAVVN